VNNFQQTLTDPYKILQDKLKSRVLKFWCPGPKGRKMAAKKVGGFFVMGTIKLFFCNRTDWHEIRCAVLNLYRRIVKIFS